MTTQKHLKQLVRARMEKTGERYAAARRHLVRTVDSDDRDPVTRWHMPGNIPATTALRILLTHAGVRAPHTGQPVSEAMLYGMAGGIGIGVFAFYYAKEDVATFFLGGRHAWYDDLAYLNNALAAFGITPVVFETSGARTAAQQLTDALKQYGPVIAWVDMASLPQRAMPAAWQGGGYHVVTVYRIQDDGTALIGDLTDEPIAIPLDALAQARGRIKKQRYRLLALPATSSSINLNDLAAGGLRHCHEGLLNPGLPGSQNNARLVALKTWAERMHGSKDKESWERVFRPGSNLWRGLASIYDFIEHYGTGGGLGRPLMADFLSEAADALAKPRLTELGEHYADLGRQWSELADAALPDAVPLFSQAKALYARKAEFTHSGAPADEVRTVWQQLGDLEATAKAQFPLSEAECADLRAGLKPRILALYESEVAAQAALLGALA